ncbi:MAG: FtsX-like permease family protein [Lacunisphaera sp.]
MLTLLAWLVAAVASASVLVSIYNSMSARQRDIAILRALGARRSTVFGAIVGEAAVIGVLGAAVGFAVFAVLAAVVANIIQGQDRRRARAAEMESGFLVGSRDVHRPLRARRICAGVQSLSRVRGRNDRAGFVSAGWNRFAILQRPGR